jgi:hypothetical protein
MHEHMFKINPEDQNCFCIPIAKVRWNSRLFCKIVISFIYINRSSLFSRKKKIYPFNLFNITCIDSLFFLQSHFIYSVLSAYSRQPNYTSISIWRSDWYHHTLGRFRKANPVFTKVQGRVVSSHEYNLATLLQFHNVLQ